MHSTSFADGPGRRITSTPEAAGGKISSHFYSHRSSTCFPWQYQDCGLLKVRGYGQGLAQNGCSKNGSQKERRNQGWRKGTKEEKGRNCWRKRIKRGESENKITWFMGLSQEPSPVKDAVQPPEENSEPCKPIFYYFSNFPSKGHIIFCHAS